jgi:hypothetical protein
MGQYFYIENLSRPSEKRVFGGKLGEWIWEDVIKEHGWSESDIIVARGDGGSEYWYAESEIKCEALNIAKLLTLFANKFNLTVPANQIDEFALEFTKSSHYDDTNADDTDVDDTDVVDTDVDDTNVDDTDEKPDPKTEKLRNIYDNIDKIKSSIYKKN